MRPTTAYSAVLGDREPLEAIRENTDRVRSLTTGWTEPQFERTYASGKWTARQVLIHLAQTEMALGTRARMALSTPDYVAQRFDQDTWVVRESRLKGPDAVAAFVALSQMNRILFENLTPADLQIAMAHPEYGAITVDWIVHLLAGHQIHHLRQLAMVK
jgi:DinB family protein